MKNKVGIDSNTLTYLVESMDPDYDPSIDESNVADERIALLRIYLYGGVPFHVVPTVTSEYQKIKNKLRKETHESLSQILLLDESWNLKDDEIKTRLTRYLNLHNKGNDCRIVAEAELGGLSSLLTCDSDILKHLQTNTIIDIMLPSDYWSKLAIAHGAQPVFSPHDTNPLNNKTWWRW
jgi:predicted nucleic-acid-binding protein